MKKSLRLMSMLFALVLCFSLLAACSSDAGANKNTNGASNNDAVPTTEAAGTEPFVAPPDQIGKVIAADSALITWNAYAYDDDTIDFMGVNVNDLGKAAEEMTLFYLEDDVTYYVIKEAKLVDATIDDVVSGAIVGVTTLEEGVQELYILYVPVEDDGSGDYEDVVEEIVEDTIPEETVAATEDYVFTDDNAPEDEESESSAAEENTDTQTP